jgi:hypothetical protein
MSSGRVVAVRIDSLVAPGVRASDARLLVRAAERELARLVGSSGAGWPGQDGSRVASLSADVPAGASPAAAGTRLARTLYSELGR